MPTVAVTGGAGFVGKRTCLALRMAGLEPFVIDPAYAPAIGCSGAARIIEGATVDRDLYAVVHLASPVGTFGVVEQAGVVAARILSAAHAALELAMTHDCPLINVSTSEVYGVQPSAAAAIHEAASTQYPARWSPRLAYATGKLAAENDLHCSAHRSRVVTVRPFNIAGPGQDARLGFVIPRFVDQAIRGERLTIFGAGTLKRGFMHVDDLARLLVVLCSNRKADGQLLNAAGPWHNVITMRDLACRVVKIADARGYHIKGDPYEYVDGRSVFGSEWEEAAAGSKIGDAAKAERLTGWRSGTRLDVIIMDVIREHAAASGSGRLADSR